MRRVSPSAAAGYGALYGLGAALLYVLSAAVLLAAGDVHGSGTAYDALGTLLAVLLYAPPVAGVVGVVLGLGVALVARGRRRAALVAPLLVTALWGVSAAAVVSTRSTDVAGVGLFLALPALISAAAAWRCGCRIERGRAYGAAPL